MKKLLALLTVLVLMFLGTNNLYAQTNDGVDQDTANQTVQTDTNAVDSAQTPTLQNKEDLKEEQAANEETGIHQVIKQKFIEGGAGFMGIVLVALILGLAIAIERILYLAFASINKEKFLKQIEEALESGGIEAAKEVCRNTRGPLASIFYEGLDRYDQGIDVVEKAVITYGSVQMGLLERGLTWISLFIAIAPMLGFMGTVIGMIEAFDAIEKAGDISAGLVAHGIKVALLTTLFGLIVAIFLQLFYNYITSKIDSLVVEMEDASVDLIDMLYKYNKK
jgi:biopolymer transport protein ExbB